MILKPGDRVVRNRETWELPDLSDPRAGLGVGVVFDLCWVNRLPNQPQNAATVCWHGLYYISEFHEILPAGPEADATDYSRPEVMWRGLAEEWLSVYGTPIGERFLDELRRQHEARQRAMQEDR